MNLEYWMKQRDTAEYFIACGVHIAPNIFRREEAEQEIERILRA